MSPAGQALIIFGAPCAGKSALSKVFQSVAAEPYLYLGLDTFFAAVPERWSGGPVGEFRAEGFEYVRPPQSDGQPFLQVAYGDVGWRILRGMHDAVAALVRAGNNVVFDDMPLDLEALLDWRRALADVRASAVFLDVPLTVAEEREQGRQESIHGLARGHYELMTKISDVDLRLDATKPLEDLAAELVAHTSALGASSPGIRLSLN